MSESWFDNLFGGSGFDGQDRGYVGDIFSRVGSTLMDGITGSKGAQNPVVSGGTPPIGDGKAPITPGKPQERSFLSDLFSGENILGALTTGAGMMQKGTAEQKAIDTKNMDFEQKKALAAQQHDFDMELLKAKLAAGGDGGVGAQIAAQKARDRYAGMLNAGQHSVESRTNDTSNIIAALKAYMEGGTAPLRR